MQTDSCEYTFTGTSFYACLIYFIGISLHLSAVAADKNPIYPQYLRKTIYSSLCKGILVANPKITEFYDANVNSHLQYRAIMHPNKGECRAFSLDLFSRIPFFRALYSSVCASGGLRIFIFRGFTSVSHVDHVAIDFALLSPSLFSGEGDDEKMIKAPCLSNFTQATRQLRKACP